MAKPRPLTIFSISCAIIILCTTIWWQHSSHPTNSTSKFLSALRPALSVPPFHELSASADGYPIREKVAVIVDSRATTSLIPIITHFATVLGPEWPIIFLTRASVVHTLAAVNNGSQPFRRLVDSGQVKIIELPSNIPPFNYEGVSHFLASSWFWNQLSPAKHMFLFQTDSMICVNSGRRVDDYLEYDFIGAAHPYFPQAFNGGLSLRNISLSKQVVERYNIADDVGEKGNTYGIYEDVWFWDKMKDMGAHFPSREVAGEFSVDYEWRERPLGFHGLGKNDQVTRTEEIYKWCPEAAIAQPGQEVKLSAEELERFEPVHDGETEGGRRLSF
jgi:hypothetical protein